MRLACLLRIVLIALIALIALIDMEGPSPLWGAPFSGHMVELYKTAGYERARGWPTSRAPL